MTNFVSSVIAFWNEMIIQREITLRPYPRGIHLVTGEIMRQLPELPSKGLMNIFIKHSSAALALNENADPDVREDLAEIFNRLVPDNAPYYLHTSEGADDMPAHAKSVIVGSSINLPICSHRLNIGLWQGIYLCEFRNNGGKRSIVITIIGE